jgi:predicted HTH transcriptional regulator
MTSIDTILEWIGSGEALQIEFKSDLKKLPYVEIAEEIVALANSNGGVLLLGVEDDGRLTGLHGSRKITTLCRVMCKSFRHDKTETRGRNHVRERNKASATQDRHAEFGAYPARIG